VRFSCAAQQCLYDVERRPLEEDALSFCLGEKFAPPVEGHFDGLYTLAQQQQTLRCHQHQQQQRQQQPLH
jgi:hypothetical protein